MSAKFNLKLNKNEIKLCCLFSLHNIQEVQTRTKHTYSQYIGILEKYKFNTVFL